LLFYKLELIQYLPQEVIRESLAIRYEKHRAGQELWHTFVIPALGMRDGRDGKIVVQGQPR
jgi:hypothetical protein